MTLPATFMMERDGTFDCAFMASTTNNFVPKGERNANRTQRSGSIITANIYGSASRTRRRLSESVEHSTSACFPYFITMSMTMSKASSFNLSLKLDESAEFPSCDFWNTNDSYWDTDGCFVYDIINDSVICGCTHLTTFGVSDVDIFPEANVLSKSDWRSLTASNLGEHPTVWLTCLSVAVLFIFICLINPNDSNVHTRSILGITSSRSICLDLFLMFHCLSA